jgi:hypothetical protein
MALLSVDWDWVTGDCSDPVSNGCCGWCDRPMCVPGRGSDSQLSKEWLARKSILMGMKPSGADGHVHVAECHADILRVVDPRRTGEVIHLDSHMDDGDFFPLNCGSWRTFMPGSIVVRTPFNGEGLESLVFHDVFMCLSSPWTPSSKDGVFWEVVRHMAYAAGRDPEFIGHKSDAMRRAWLHGGRRSGA